MIETKSNKFYVKTKVQGVSGGPVPGKYFGYTGRAKAKIHAQPLLKEIAIDPAQIDAVYIKNMIVYVSINGHDHPIGMAGKKYACIAENKHMKVRNFEITGYSESLVPGKEYMRLGMNITFEVTAEEKDIFLTTNRNEVLHNGDTDTVRKKVQAIP